MNDALIPPPRRGSFPPESLARPYLTNGRLVEKQLQPLGQPATRQVLLERAHSL